MIKSGNRQNAGKYLMNCFGKEFSYLRFRKRGIVAEI
jgi:hypothetical protein